MSGLPNGKMDGPTRQVALDAIKSALIGYREDLARAGASPAQVAHCAGAIDGLSYAYQQIASYPTESTP